MQASSAYLGDGFFMSAEEDRTKLAEIHRALVGDPLDPEGARGIVGNLRDLRQAFVEHMAEEERLISERTAREAAEAKERADIATALKVHIASDDERAARAEQQRADLAAKTDRAVAMLEKSSIVRLPFGIRLTPASFVGALIVVAAAIVMLARYLGPDATERVLTRGVEVAGERSPAPRPAQPDGGAR